MFAFGRILDDVLAENIAHQSLSLHNRKLMSTRDWLEEYCTISLGYARQTGKTTAIAQRASRRDLVVALNTGMAKIIKDAAVFDPHIVIQKKAADRNQTVFRGRQYDRIWVDDASLFTGLDSILDIAVQCRAIQIILIG